MLIIRLSRFGRKNKAIYRIVVADHHRAVKRKYIEKLGWYDTTTNPNTLELKEEKIRGWMQKGAKTSVAVAKILEKYSKDKTLMKDFGLDKILKDTRSKPPKAKKSKEEKPQSPVDQGKTASTKESQGGEELVSEENEKKEDSVAEEVQASTLVEGEVGGMTENVGQEKPVKEAIEGNKETVVEKVQDKEAEKSK